MTAVTNVDKFPGRWIELGCGNNPDPRCHIHTDARSFPGVTDFTCDLGEPLPIKDGDFDGILCRYALEHVSWRNVKGLVKECHRILRPGGKALFVTANLHEQCKMFVEKEDAGEGEDRWVCQIFGDNDYPENTHRCGFSPVAAARTFREAGFRDVVVRPLPEWKGDMVIEAMKGNDPIVKVTETVVERWDTGVAPRKRKFAFDWGGALENNESVRQIARDLHAAGYEVHVIPAAGVMPTDETYAQWLGALNVPFVGFHRVFVRDGQTHEETARGKVEAMRKAGCSVLYDDSDFNLAAVKEAGFESVKVTRDNIVARPPELSMSVIQPASESVPIKKDVPPDPPDLEKERIRRLDSAGRAELYDRVYWNGGKLGGGYAGMGCLDFPCHEATFRHVMQRKPRSVLELGCGRGYILKRLEDAGVPCLGLDISKHCYLTRACDAVHHADICREWPFRSLEGGSCMRWGGPHGWKDKIPGEDKFDLCLSVAFLELIPEQHVEAVCKEMARTCERGLHGVDFGRNSDGNDKTKVTLKPRQWWVERLPPGHEVVDKDELEAGALPDEFFKGDGKLKLNIGCAWTMFHHGWINVDVLDQKGFADAFRHEFVRCDVRNGLPWATGSVDLIHCQHMLEHVSYAEGLSFLRECRRVLKPQTGAMRFAVPDGEKLMGWYINHQDRLREMDELNEGCSKAKTAAGKLWALLHEGHAAVYDAETLCDALEDAGFVTSQAAFRRTLSGDNCRQICRETLDMLPEISCYVDAVPRTN